jgi:hypothetical protein
MDSPNPVWGREYAVSNNSSRERRGLFSLHCEPQKLALLVFGNPSRSASICFAN